MNFTLNKETSIILGEIYAKYYLHDKSRPLVVTFANSGNTVDQKQIESSTSPWGFEFLKKKGLNVLSFSGIKGRENYYRDSTFHSLLPSISDALPSFPERLGYGGSMGAYAVSAYSNILKLDRLLLLNPISSRRKDIAVWDYEAKRNLGTFYYDWSGPYSDGADTKSLGYVIYDPLFDLDKKHAIRYSNLTQLKFPGVGHGIPIYMQEIGILGWTVDKFLDNSLNSTEFHAKVRARRDIIRYYDWMTRKGNKHLTPKRKEIILKHKEKKFPESLAPNSFSSVPITKREVERLKKAATLLEDVDTSLSLDLMKIAQQARPEGTFIAKKIREYKATIKRHHTQLPKSL